MKYRLPSPSRHAALMLVTALRDGRDPFPAAAAIAAKAASGGQPALLIELREGRPRRAGVFSTALSRGLAEIVNASGVGCEAVARGSFCSVTLPLDAAVAGDVVGELAGLLPEGALCVVSAPGAAFRALAEMEAVKATSAVLVAELPRERAAAALTCKDLSARGIRCRVWKPGTGVLAATLAGAGLAPPGRTGELAAGMLAKLAGVRGERGQVTVLMTGFLLVAVLVAVALAALGGALTGKGRMQRAADLAAVSAARSLRDDLPRRLSPATVNGVPNPFHLSRGRYLARARAAAVRGAAANGAGPWRVRVRFPGAVSPAPLLAEVRLRGRWGDQPVAVLARAEARMPLAGLAGASLPAASTSARGGGYSGPLATRQGRQMRPDVALAFDHMAAAAQADGHSLIISSAFRSDAEQAVLFAANPDPKWVAPPGTSLHRCGTELDLGPASAYGWLAANAARFGYTIRYPWEPWHAGFDAGPPPCSAAANAARFRDGDGLIAASAGMPGYVPGWLTPHLERAAGRWGVSLPLLAAQLQAESNFDPDAVSPVGAQGIAQFMPGTAAAYGLRDPFDPAQAVMAQAHLMADLLRQFGGSVELALAAYNAGPGAVAPCMCVPSFPETIAYVAKITALLSGAATGLTPSPPLEVRLIE